MASKDEVRVVASTGGEKGSKQDRFDLIPAEALRELAEHYGKGALKYADNNWRRGYPWHLSIAALHRHLNAFERGEDLDSDTPGIAEGHDVPLSKHMIAVAWHALALAVFMDEHPELDDRWATTGFVDVP